MGGGTGYWQSPQRSGWWNSILVRNSSDCDLNWRGKSTWSSLLCLLDDRFDFWLLWLLIALISYHFSEIWNGTSTHLFPWCHCTFHCDTHPLPIHLSEGHLPFSTFYPKSATKPAIHLRNATGEGPCSFVLSYDDTTSQVTGLDVSDIRWILIRLF